MNGYKSARAAFAMETCCCSPPMRWPPGCLNGMKRGDHYGIGFTGSSVRLRALPRWSPTAAKMRSEEHTSELQSPCNLVCRLLLEKKKIINYKITILLITE